MTSYLEWANSWISLAAFPGRDVPEGRIEDVLALWVQPVPGAWARGADARILDPKVRYTRTHSGERRGEHGLEHQVIGPAPTARRTLVFGERLIDGVNAVPLAKDPNGGRAGNVEADMLLWTDGPGQYLVEVKCEANHASYAAVELLRQLRLFQDSAAAQRIASRRLHVPSPVTTAVVLAPQAFYEAPGRRSAVIERTVELSTALASTHEVDLRLAVWDFEARVIDRLAT